MAILRNTAGRQVKAPAGLQVAQYAKQLHQAGMLAPVTRARGLERARLERAAAVLISYLRSGEVSTRSKLCASQLGLTHYPDNTEGIQ